MIAKGCFCREFVLSVEAFVTIIIIKRTSDVPGFMFVCAQEDRSKRIGRGLKNLLLLSENAAKEFRSNIAAGPVYLLFPIKFNFDYNTLIRK